MLLDGVNKIFNIMSLIEFNLLVFFFFFFFFNNLTYWF